MFQSRGVAVLETALAVRIRLCLLDRVAVELHGHARQPATDCAVEPLVAFTGGALRRQFLLQRGDRRGLGLAGIAAAGQPRLEPILHRALPPPRTIHLREPKSKSPTPHNHYQSTTPHPVS